ncbi:MAG: DUF2461 family protein [Oscillospiraceae bacterium]|nr:DUF2461 family protein [Oscillospiraceae bacterium]
MRYITEEMLEFLAGIRSHNEKEWFENHKEIYLKAVYEPLKAMSEELYQPYQEYQMMQKTARIYRDVNFPPYLHYRDTFWIYIRHEAVYWNQTPTLFFEISPEGAKFGFRIASPEPRFMEFFRNRIAGAPEEFLNLISELEKKQIPLTGEEYKRPKPCENQKLLPYFKKKSLVAERSITDRKLLCSDALTSEVQKTLADVFDFYQYCYELMQNYEASRQKPEQKKQDTQPEIFMRKAPEQEFMW